MQIDEKLLDEVGLGGLSPQQKQGALAKISGIFESRLGDRLMDGLSDAQLDEFEQYVQKVDETGGLAWLEQNVPSYKQIVADVLAQVKADVAANGIDALSSQTASA